MGENRRHNDVPEINALAPALGVVIGALLTYLAVIHAQHMTTAREREARESERLAKRQQARDEFQSRCLIQSQRLAMKLTQQTVFLESIKQSAPSELAQADRVRKIKDVSQEVWALINNLSHVRERLHDGELRAKLENLAQGAGAYLADAAGSHTIQASTTDMSSRFNEVNYLLGERLRELT